MEPSIFQSGADLGGVSQFEGFVLLYLFVVSLGAMFFVNEKRGPSNEYQRLKWKEYCKKHLGRGTFKRRLRMEKESFHILLSYVYHDLLVKEQYAGLRGGTIIPELCLYCTLRWLAGGSYLDIVDIAGISDASFYRVVWKTIMAIVECPELALKWPMYPNEIQEAIAGFLSISFDDAINNCARGVDGYLTRVKVPSKKYVSNVQSFFSGHYQCYGVNCQGVADHHSRFTYFAVAAPGVTKDRDAIVHCGLSELIEDLSHGICILGDAAYEPTEHLVLVYQGVERAKEKYDNFNFYASQLRIRVEMAFGIMTKKWGILNRLLTIALPNVKWVSMQAIVRLHSFVINERLRMKKGTESDPEPDNSQSYLPTIPHKQNGDPVSLDKLFSTEDFQTYDGFSGLQEAMANRVAWKKLTRPASNKLCNHVEEEHDEFGLL
jgi:DDE superfamily endonuclease